MSPRESEFPAPRIASYAEELVLLTTKEARRLIGCDTGELTRRRHTGDVPSIRHRCGGWLWTIEDCRRIREALAIDRAPGVLGADVVIPRQRQRQF